MRIGTKSVLFGAHAFWMHPWFVALAWWQLFGFPRDYRLWVAFFVHDLGYFGRANMDGAEGEEHVYLGARLMSRLFDRNGSRRWYHFCVYHSRFWSKRHGTKPSRLCHADKLAIALTPAWLYVPMTRLTGEIREYRSIAKHRAELDSPQNDVSFGADWRWYRNLQTMMADMVWSGDVTA